MTTQPTTRGAIRSLLLVALLLVAGCTGPPDPSPAASMDAQEPSRFRTDEEQARIPAAVADRRTPNITAATFDTWLGSRAPPVEDVVTASDQGRIIACGRVSHTNRVSVVILWGIEIYYLPAGGDGEPELVAGPMGGSRGTILDPDLAALPHLTHDIKLQETARGQGSDRYLAHFWHEILLPPEIPRGTRGEAIVAAAVPADPPLREDQWYNLTFEPLTTGTYHGDGQVCEP